MNMHKKLTHNWSEMNYSLTNGNNSVCKKTTQSVIKILSMLQVNNKNTTNNGSDQK